MPERRVALAPGVATLVCVPVNGKPRLSGFRGAHFKARPGMGAVFFAAVPVARGPAPATPSEGAI